MVVVEVREAMVSRTLEILLKMVKMGIRVGVEE